MQAQYGNPPHSWSLLPVSFAVCGCWRGLSSQSRMGLHLRPFRRDRLHAAVCVCLPSRPSPRPATRLRLLPFMALSSSTNFKRPTVLISEGALPPSQEGRAITELANYTLGLGVCFIQAMALWTFWSGPGKKRPLLTKLYRLKAYRMSWESAVYHLTLVFLIQGIKQR